ncbi:hypothetical protein HG1285_06255 [Hydrogenivirga sp. 128-5-R1-1]|nr:hypothetical protein HG1285_06255 [Hydrogenivirga sp. 128-5-R1-1]
MGFEPTEGCEPSRDFKSPAFVRSATPPACVKGLPSSVLALVDLHLKLLDKVFYEIN